MEPFEPPTTPAVERANRLLALTAQPGYVDLMKISQQLVEQATTSLIDFPGWDPLQMAALKARAQAVKEHHVILFGRVQDAIREGMIEVSSSPQPEKTPREIIDEADRLRAELLLSQEKGVMVGSDDFRIAGSY